MIWEWFTNNRKLLELRLDARLFELSLALHWGRDNGECRLSVSVMDFGCFGDGGLITLLAVHLWLVSVNLCLEV
jgi:hypothetical protein